MNITWADAGKGPVDLTLANVHHLAVEAGFVFDVDATQPLSKRANLQSKQDAKCKTHFPSLDNQIPFSHFLVGNVFILIPPSLFIFLSPAELFDRFNVNSLTAFKQKFFTYQLDPHINKDTSSSRPVWTSKELLNKNTGAGTDHYIGQLLHGKPHGPGILLSQGTTSHYIYIGSFEDGLQNGFGIILTPRGESFHGCFKDGETYGPGTYTFPTPQSKQNIVKRHRVRFDGMHLGRPFGKGVVVWSDGDRECGEFDGMKLKRHVSLEDCQGVLLVAAQNAEMAKRVASETEDDLKRWELWEGKAEILLAKARGQSR
jgi:hypothetical protein